MILFLCVLIPVSMVAFSTFQFLRLQDMLNCGGFFGHRVSYVGVADLLKEIICLFIYLL